MRVLGITGGIGTGKSTVLQYLEQEFGAFVIQADAVGHFLMEPGQCCYEPVVRLFGKDVVKNDKTIDRRKISDIVFSRAEMLQRLNAIVHPAVKQYIRMQVEEKEREGCPLVVVEAALLLEDHYEEICDAIWYIHTEEEIRIARLIQSRGYTRQKAESVIRNQAPADFFRAHTQYEIDNSGSFESTCRQIKEGIRIYYEAL